MRLRKRFPDLRVDCVVGDFWTAQIPSDLARAPRVGFFPGSTIGNMEPDDAQALLRRFGRVLGAGSRLIIGVDVIKDPAILIPAYDDAEGVTAAFNLNLLARANRELGADFDLAGFRHAAIWNARMTRIEMRLVSLREQVVHVAAARSASTPAKRSTPRTRINGQRMCSIASSPPPGGALRPAGAMTVGSSGCSNCETSADRSSASRLFLDACVSTG